MKIKLFLLWLLSFSVMLVSCTEEPSVNHNSELIDVSAGLNEIEHAYQNLLSQESVLIDILYRVDSNTSSSSYSRTYVNGQEDSLKYHQVFISYDDLAQLESSSPEITEYIYDGKSYRVINNGETVMESDTSLTKEKLMQFSMSEWKKGDIKEIYKVVSGEHSLYTIVLSDAHFDKHSHSADEGESGIPQELLTRTYTVTIDLKSGLLEHTSQHDVVSTTMFGETQQYNRYTDCSYQIPASGLE